MKSIFLESGHIKLYKRENSQYWQMRIKPPREKATRESTGCKSLRDAKDIALKKYTLINTFLLLIKQAAVDCELFKNVNMIEEKYQV